MQAVILAAGMGNRLKDLTKNNTKCMLAINGKRLIDRALEALDTLKLNKIIIVVGYQKDNLIEHIENLSNIRTPIQFINNKDYATTNNIYSLYLARNELKNDSTILLESDVIFDPEMLADLVKDPRENLALVAPFESWMDGTVVTLSDTNSITNILDKKKYSFSDDLSKYYKTVNIYKFSKSFLNTEYLPFLEAYSVALGRNSYYEQVLKVILMLETSSLKGLITNKKWYEIDDEQDKDLAEILFEDSIEKKYKLIAKRYGGFWRFPGLLDYCYLVNPYFPSSNLMEELEYMFPRLLTEYPSGQDVNSFLAGKIFGLKKNYIASGNGAAELIKSIISKSHSSKIGIIEPSFEEYRNRIKNDRIITFRSNKPDFSFCAEDLIEHFSEKDLDALVIVNPDNPTGTFITKDGIFKLLAWTKKNNITLIFDESFIDFAEDSYTLLENSVLEEYKNLIVIKSISKSYGVPGLRLGVIASSDEDLIQFIKKDISIWNINSFGEYFLQIYEKYKSGYLESLELIKNERSRFFTALNKTKLIKPFPSNANYFLCKVNEIDPKILSYKLLDEYNIFIKTLENKKGIDGPFIRISVRDEIDNNRFISAINEIEKEL